MTVKAPTNTALTENDVQIIREVLNHMMIDLNEVLGCQVIKRVIANDKTGRFMLPLGDKLDNDQVEALSYIWLQGKIADNSDNPNVKISPSKNMKDLYSFLLGDGDTNTTYSGAKAEVILNVRPHKRRKGLIDYERGTSARDRAKALKAEAMNATDEMACELARWGYRVVRRLVQHCNGVTTLAFQVRRL